MFKGHVCVFLLFFFAKLVHLSHVPEVQVSVSEVFPERDVQRDLGVVVVVAEVQVFVQCVFHSEGLVAVQPFPSAIRVQQRAERLQVQLSERSNQTLVEPQLVQEDLSGAECGQWPIFIFSQM